MQRVTAQLGLIITVCFLAVPQVVSASFEITEIMYSPEGADAGHEWVEVKNVSSSAVDLSAWSLRENDTDHRIEPEDQAEVAAGARAIIADDPQKFSSNYTADGPVFDSSFSLRNSGEVLELIDAEGGVADSVTYDTDIGADGNGDSLQLTNSGWVAASPTPTKDYSGESDDNEEDSDDSNNTDDPADVRAASVLTPRDDEESDNYAAEDQPVRIDAGSDMHMIAGVQKQLRGHVSLPGDDTISKYDVSWSLGNGDMRDGINVFYAYDHPGRYVATLMLVGDEIRKSDQRTVTVLAPDISITKTKSGINGFITIVNNMPRDVNLSGWHLRAKRNAVTLPDYTIALAGEKLTLADKAVDLTDVSQVDLLYPNGKAAVRYPQSDSNRVGSSTPVGETSSEVQVEDGSTRSHADSDVNSVPSAEAIQDATNTKPTTTALSELFATTTQAAAAAGSANSHRVFWQWGLLLVIIVVFGVGVSTLLSSVSSDESSPDLVTDTFDINEL